MAVYFAATAPDFCQSNEMTNVRLNNSTKLIDVPAGTGEPSPEEPLLHQYGAYGAKSGACTIIFRDKWLNGQYGDGKC